MVSSFSPQLFQARIREIGPPHCPGAGVRLLHLCQKKSYPQELSQLKKGQPVATTPPFFSYVLYLEMMGSSESEDDWRIRISVTSQHTPLSWTRAPESRNYWYFKCTSSRSTPDRIPCCPSVSHQCIACQNVYAKTASQLMGQLPAARSRLSPPFSTVGIDYAQCKRGNPRKPTLVRCYICLLICFSTKAIHLELISDLTSVAAFLAVNHFTQLALRVRGN